MGCVGYRWGAVGAPWALGERRRGRSQQALRLGMGGRRGAAVIGRPSRPASAETGLGEPVQAVGTPVE